MTRVIHLTAAEVRTQFWDAATDAGIDRDFLDRLLTDHGVDAAADWLVEHSFPRLDDQLRMAAFLLDGRP